MKTLCIIPCGKSKIWDKNPGAGPTKARHVYTGPFASKCQEYARKFYPEAWIILSAKYGFLWPDDIIPGPYNVTFNDPTTGPISINEVIRSAQEKGLVGYDEIVIVAGKKYVEMARQAFPGKAIREPLKGCGGNLLMTKRMKEAIESGRPLG